MRPDILRLFRPTRYFRDVFSLDPAMLAAEGFKALLVDLDNTLIPRKAPEVPERVVEWAVSVREAGLAGFLVSNNWQVRVAEVAEEIGFEAIPKALKPLPSGLLRACRSACAAPREAVMIGDQVFTDVLAGNMIGATTVLVLPLNGPDLPHTRLLRRLEAGIMAGREPQGRATRDERKEPAE